jgi:hypothetical protein
MKSLEVGSDIPPQPPDMTILTRYEVRQHAYGRCDLCEQTFDYWKYGEDDFMCPFHCGNPLRELTQTELAIALLNCEEDGCFSGDYSYGIPLKPMPKRLGVKPDWRTLRR